MLNPAQFFLFASLPFITIADSVPKFDTARECRSEGGSDAALEKCIEDESAARDQLHHYGFNPVRLTKPPASEKPA